MTISLGDIIQWDDIDLLIDKEITDAGKKYFRCLFHNENDDEESVILNTEYLESLKGAHSESKGTNSTECDTQLDMLG